MGEATVENTSHRADPEKADRSRMDAEGTDFMGILIRKARPDDAAGIINVLNPIVEAGRYTVLDRTLTEVEERDFIINFPDRGIFHVAERNSDRNIVGFQVIEPFATYTHAFDHVAGIGTFVDLSERRQGIGERLSEETFRVAKECGFEKIFTYILAHNQPSLAFHVKIGFHVVGIARRHARIHGEYVDEILVERFL